MRLIQTGIFVLLVALGVSVPAAAQASGTLSGTIKIHDSRHDPYARNLDMAYPPNDRPDTPWGVYAGQYSQGSTPPNGARQLGKFITDGEASVQVRARYILVSICISTNSVPGCSYLRMVRASADGDYSHSWSISAGIPTRITIGVYPDYPNISGTYTPPGGVGHPPHNFRITVPGNPIVMLGSQSRTTSLTGNKTIDVTLSASEVGNAFLTTAEVYAMHAAQTQPSSGSILADMRNLNVYANHSVTWAPLDSVVQLATGRATKEPHTVAHELGHIVNWRAFDLVNAPLTADIYTACDPPLNPSPGWLQFTNECEKAAWAEGFANLHEGMWMWTRSALNPHIPREYDEARNMFDTPTRVGGADLNTMVEPLDCPVLHGHKRGMCNAYAMWDIIDRPALPGGDDDTIDQAIDLGHVIQVMRSYPRPCPTNGNRCVHELYNNGVLDNHGMNWRDYLHNHSLVFPGTLGALNNITSINSLASSTDG
jgi:hypothetical protein